MNRLLRAAIGLLSTVLVLLALASTGGPATALGSAGRAIGFVSTADRSSWIGSYRMSDGRTGLCLDVTKRAPVTGEFSYQEGSGSGRYSPDDSARLAYLSREWIASADPVTVAAAALTVWRMTGLAGKSVDHYAGRANEWAPVVRQLSDRMLDRLDREAGTASRGVQASLDLDLAAGTAVSHLVVDFLTPGPSVIPSGIHSGLMRLTGATFDDGATERRVSNGEVVRIAPTAGTPVAEVRAAIDYSDLPYGSAFVIARAEAGIQDVLVENPFSASAHAESTAQAPSPAPFAPQTRTTTGSPLVYPGAELSDTIELSAQEGPGLTAWGVRQLPSGSYSPIPVVVESTLYGPFEEPPAQTDAPPVDAPRLCTVETLVTDGPGVVRSPSCRVERPGWYVWADRIDPARTPPEEGGDRILPWASPFGLASETTRALAPPTVLTRVDRSDVDGPGCVRDELTVSGLTAAAEGVQIDSVLLGPFADPPVPGSTDLEWRHLPRAGATTTTVLSDGVVVTDCVRVEQPGHYYFVLSSPGTTDTAGGVPPFEDATVYASESLRFTANPTAALAATGWDAAAGTLERITATAGGAATSAVLIGALILLLAARFRSSRSGRS